MLVTTSYASHELRVVTEFMPPLQLAQPGQKMHGMTAKLVETIIKNSKYPYRSDVYPWSRSYLLATSTPNIVIYPLIRTQEREEKFHWIGRVWSFSAAVYRHKNRNDITVSTLEDAKKYNISVYRNDFFHHFLLNRGFSPSRLFAVADVEQSIKLFINGRVDLLVIDRSIFEYYVKQYQANLNDYVAAVRLKDVKQNDAYIALSKGSSPDIIKRLKQSYNRVYTSDDFSDTQRQWMTKVDTTTANTQ